MKLVVKFSIVMHCSNSNVLMSCGTNKPGQESNLNLEENIQWNPYVIFGQERKHQNLNGITMSFLDRRVGGDNVRQSRGIRVHKLRVRWKHLVIFGLERKVNSVLKARSKNVQLVSICNERRTSSDNRGIYAYISFEQERWATSDCFDGRAMENLFPPHKNPRF